MILISHRGNINGKIPELDVIKIITIAKNTKNGTLENRWVLQTIS